MILGKEGQTFSSDGRVFAVGGTAWCPRERNGELFCTIRAIRAEDNETPTAQCDFEEDGTKCLPLNALEPVSPSVPEETGKLYVLYYIYDGSCNANHSALGISSDKSVLIRKMLDDLDSDTLGIYCSMLSRYETLSKDMQSTRRKLAKVTDDADVLEILLGKLDSINSKLQRMESNILQYADKLGLTPSGRVRLAQKRAEKLAAQIDPDGDLFGD